MALVAGPLLVGSALDAHARKSRAKPSLKTTKPTVSKWAAAQNGVGAWASVNETALHTRPDHGTPVVAKVRKSFPVHVWGKHQGWYRVETHDQIFGWIHHRQLSGRNLKAVPEMSEAKMRQACERTDSQIMFGSPDQLKTYYAKFKAQGAVKGLASLGIYINGDQFVARDGSKTAVASFVSRPFAAPHRVAAQTAPPPVTPLAMTPGAFSGAVTGPAVVQVAPSFPRATQSRHLPARSKKHNTLATKNGLKPKTATPPAQLKQGGLAPISPEELMRARERYLERQSKTPAQPKRLGGNVSSAKPSQSNWVEQAQAWNALWQQSARTDNVHGVQTTYGQSDSSTAASGAESSAPEIQTLADAQQKPVVNRGGSPRDRASANLSKGIVNQALSYRGMPYRFGAASPSRGFDCSGLIYYMLRQRGYNPPRTAAGYVKYGAPVAKGSLQPGDLVLFSNTYKRGISHIGVYMGNDKFIHAASRKTGVRVDALFSGYWGKKFHSARRVPVK